MMSERTSYAPGTPCWVELGSPDLDTSIEFYGGLFGWDVPVAENAEQTGGYRLAMLHGKPVAGMAPLMQEGQPPAWTTYVSVADAGVVAGKVRDAGGAVIAEPMEVLDLGTMAIFADPTGAVFGVWRPGSFIGAEIVQRA
jgi:predicted enzyme related to lactoylglutathione lyase